MFALEIHREPNVPSSKPWFLEEIRARLFVCIYRDDKALSRVLCRLPRIPRHYCGRRVPLGVSDEKLLGPEPTLDGILHTLDADGWGSQVTHSSDWFRARYIFATYREEILGIELGPPVERNERFIRRVLIRCCGCWGPAHSNIDPDKYLHGFKMLGGGFPLACAMILYPRIPPRLVHPSSAFSSTLSIST